MENFVVSARKYRPQTFDTVVGQGSITATLKNAIKNNHLAQAFLFCGPRGVGKTTCARILAKTINCFNITENTEACDKCDSCISFNSGSSLNVFELDAASNNSVEDIRNLIEQVRYAPQLGQYKVYVIDEVHMLSSNAFNAFLKTLEEPPKHAIFILATTEKHKIIPTILSRCQIFDFNRIQIEDIAKHLAFIANSEGVTADVDALHIIAQKADGALRDACSIFDQIVSFAGNTVTYKNVIDNLNILDYDYYFKITDAFLEQNISSSLLIFNDVLNNGFDGHNFITGMAEHIRNLLVCKDVVTLSLLEVGINIRDKYKEQSQKCEVPLLIKGLAILSKADSQYKSSKNQRLLVEFTLMQLCSLGTLDTEKKNEPLKIQVQQAEAPIAQKPVVETLPVIQKEEVVNTSPPANLRSNIVSSSSINKQIAQKLTSDSNSQQAVVNVIQQKENFTQEVLDEAWTKYSKVVQAANKLSLYSTLTSRKPLLKENFSLEFEIDNKAQEEALNLEKVELMSFLRRELKNGDIQLSIIVVKKNESELKPYTPLERYKKMAEKNPEINKLRQQFDLDLDY